MKHVILIGHNLLENNTYVSAFCTRDNTQDCCNLENLWFAVSFLISTLKTQERWDKAVRSK